MSIVRANFVRKSVSNSFNFLRCMNPLTRYAFCTMKKGSLIVVVAAVSLLSAGCGGANSLINGLTGNSPFAGTYSGNWNGSSGDAGVLNNVVIDVSGNVSGNFVASNGSVGTFGHSTIANTGGMQFTATFANGSTDTLIGTMALNSAGNMLTGSGIVETGVESQTVTISLTLVGNGTKKRTQAVVEQQAEVK